MAWWVGKLVMRTEVPAQIDQIDGCWPQPGLNPCPQHAAHLGGGAKAP